MQHEETEAQKLLCYEIMLKTGAKHDRGLGFTQLASTAWNSGPKILNVVMDPRIATYLHENLVATGIILHKFSLVIVGKERLLSWIMDHQGASVAA